jgi:hypothetical protein
MASLLWVAGAANQAASAEIMAVCLPGPGVESGEAVIGRMNPKW